MGSGLDPLPVRVPVMKKSIRLALTDEELLALYQVILDEDRDGALKFLDEHLRKEVKAVLENEGH